MKKIILGVAIGIFLSAVFYFGRDLVQKQIFLSPVAYEKAPLEKPLDRYTFENLKQRPFTPAQITLGRILQETPSFTSYLFYFISDGKKVSGLMNLPKVSGTFPVIVMLRGYVDGEIYETGIGTKRVGEVLAKEGFITLSPDFLGYGQSSSPSALPIEERFETYTTVLNLLSSLPNLNSALTESALRSVKADSQKVGLWGHSNGGHIALSILAITGKPYPTVLWAPVSKPFPYSILYFTDEYDDHGKKLRQVIADFEKDYDIEKYSPANFLDWINASIQLHQGSADEAVPQKWSDELYRTLNKLDKNITYFTYPGDDHNFAKGGWSLAVTRSVSFYKKELGL